MGGSILVPGGGSGSGVWDVVVEERGLGRSDEKEGFGRLRQSDVVLDLGWGVGNGVDAV